MTKYVSKERERRKHQTTQQRIQKAKRKGAMGKSPKKLSESTSVILVIGGQWHESGGRASRNRSKAAEKSFNGKTGSDLGHAEMAALHKMIQWVKAERDVGSTTAVDIAARIIKDKRFSRVVFCPEKPVCPSCTLVLKGLGFTLGSGTTWGTKRSAGPPWGVSADVHLLLAGFDGNLEEGAKDLSDPFRVK